MGALKREFDAVIDAFFCEATSVNEFLRPLRACLDKADVLEVCVNQPGEILVETSKGWERVGSPG